MIELEMSKLQRSGSARESLGVGRDVESRRRPAIAGQTRGLLAGVLAAILLLVLAS
jgi:hypothetical protein